VNLWVRTRRVEILRRVWKFGTRLSVVGGSEWGLVVSSAVDDILEWFGAPARSRVRGGRTGLTLAVEPSRPMQFAIWVQVTRWKATQPSPSCPSSTLRIFDVRKPLPSSLPCKLGSRGYRPPCKPSVLLLLINKPMFNLVCPVLHGSDVPDGPISPASRNGRRWQAAWMGRRECLDDRVGIYRMRASPRRAGHPPA
jgi:hypothetical protein